MQIPNTGVQPDWIAQYLQGLPAGETLSEPTQALFEHLYHLNGEDIYNRTTEIRRLLRNSGFVESSDNRRWQLDALPQLLGEEDWHSIQQGILQRMQLLDLVLKDLCGERTLMTCGLINTRQLLRHPSFLRESYSLPPEQRGLCMVALDIGRDDNGQFHLLDEHCQFPKGLGMLLENRIIARRVMSEEFAECGVQRIAGFFQQVQQAINEASTGLRDPRVVILTAGSEDHHYSEHAYLATYMGYTLVRSADLTVRKGKLWLKALDGLRKVDVLLRWVEDRYLDSLEQADYSMLGVPGLLQAIRSGSVRLLNPFGSGVLRAPAVRNQMDAICRRLLGEPLRLSQMPTAAANQMANGSWAGQELRSQVDPGFLLDGDKDQEAIANAIAQAIRQNTDDLYFIQKPQLSQAPFWHKKQLINRPVTYRFFALWRNGVVHILPSALCLARDPMVGGSPQWIKDTWVLTAEPVEQAFSLPKASRRTADLALVEGLIPSRTAENLFWLGCYLERCESACRLLRLFIDRFTELAMYPDIRSHSAVAWLKAGLDRQSLLYPFNPMQKDNLASQSAQCKKTVQSAMTDKLLPGTLVSVLGALLSSAMQVRELLSYDSLRIIENLETEKRRLEKSSGNVATHVLQTTLDKIIGQVMAFNGSVVDSMSNSNGWFMLGIGRRVERSMQLVSICASLLTEELPEAEQHGLLEAVLTTHVSSITHRRRYRMYQSVDTGLELLLLDGEYPRSLAFQINQLIDLCKRLPAKTSPGFLSATDKALLRLKTDCSLNEREQLGAVVDGHRPHLQKLLQAARAHLEEFQETLQVQYFSHTKQAKKLDWSSQGAPA
ncbi:circularly permuted type 2 ATP-grasp protein [Aliiglaciecola sp. CAU 1673]|uniref:circularly permuted type 2 ATP-grasp protein n=1 Tax=Aliiglaciecola sp. CAU 1673 TaxID=3032595 RepID=UPI0023D997A3|nr:circularly permuted type 2 ATP-grasp protein [Aliiglaciecola sp. CAU 1673]MDF2176826.1 circularly permuted type 2 ATP-grasp protein [Aliiglaciecola sp. CAU 1673]